MNETGGRANQLRRTRKDLLQAAARLTRLGHQPSLDEVAAEAMVSRATAYRHFPDLNALLVEASLDIDTPHAERLFQDAPPQDPVARMERVDAALETMIRDNEVALRLMMKHALERSVQPAGDGAMPVRQNRRTPLIDAALHARLPAFLLTSKKLPGFCQGFGLRLPAASTPGPSFRPRIVRC